MSRIIGRWALAAFGAFALFVAPFSVATISTPALANSAPGSCPVGEGSDAEDTGWPCQPDCPPGMLLDGVTQVCVAAPGVPPPPLPAGAYSAE